MTRPSPSAALRWLLGAVVVALVAGGAYWAGRATVSPPGLASQPAPAVTVVVKEATIGRSQNVNATVERARTPLAANLLTGMVTAVREPGTVAEGDVLYAVDGREVRAVAGTVPFYRSLAPGTSGPDVRQLQEWLARSGIPVTASGTFDAATESAVAQWQQARGLLATGAIGRGELVAVPTLPATVSPDPSLRVGGVVHEGDAVLSTTSAMPRFTLELSPDRSRALTDATLTVIHQSSTWPAVRAQTTTNQQGNDVVELTAPDGGPVCGQDCGTLAAGEKAYVPVKAQLVEPATGPAIPVAALRTRPDGSTTVTVVRGDDRETRTVQVLGSQDGVAVVKGVTVGEAVLVLDSRPATDAAASVPPPTPR